MCQQEFSWIGDSNWYFIYILHLLYANKLLSNAYFRISKDLPPCLNCLLIEMGEMACYQERCPECGRIAPSHQICVRSWLVEDCQQQQNTSKPTAAMVMEAWTRTNQLAFPDSFPPLQNGHGSARRSSDQHFAKQDNSVTVNGSYGSNQLKRVSMV